MTKRKAADEEDHAQAHVEAHVEAHVKVHAGGDPRAQTEAGRRILHTHLMFWRACTEKSCKRARACRGEIEACWRRWRPCVPDEFMERFRIAINERLAGASIGDALRAAEVHIEALRAVRAKLDDQTREHDAKAPAALGGSSPDHIATKSPRMRIV